MAQEKLKSSLPELIQMPRALETDLPGATAEAPDEREDRETGHVATQARTKADNELDKLLVLKQEYHKLKQEVSAPDVTNPAENLVLPQPETVADEAAKAELNELLA